MDAAQERLQALSHTQQALMDKIKALDELDQADGKPLSPAPAASTCTPRPARTPKHCLSGATPPPLTDYGEQRHLQEQRPRPPPLACLPRRPHDQHAQAPRGRRLRLWSRCRTSCSGTPRARWSLTRAQGQPRLENAPSPWCRGQLNSFSLK
jgi:hypothetical protein